MFVAWALAVLFFEFAGPMTTSNFIFIFLMAQCCIKCHLVEGVDYASVYDCVLIAVNYHFLVPGQLSYIEANHSYKLDHAPEATFPLV